MVAVSKFFLVVCLNLIIYCQAWCQLSNDSLLLLNSERFEVKLNRGLFGLARPRFGSYSTVALSKMDSTVTRKKTKDSTWFGADISSDQTDFDHSKFLTIEKTRFYSLDLASDTQISRAVFAIQSVSHEKRQTFLGKLISKNDEGKNVVLDVNRNVPGTIYIRATRNPGRFLSTILPVAGRLRNLGPGMHLLREAI